MADEIHSLTQKRFLQGSQVFAIEDGRLKVECRRGLSLHQYRFELRGFLADPLRIKRVPLVGMIGCAVAVLVLGILFYAGFRATDEDTWITIAGLAAFLLIFIVIVATKSILGFVNLVLFQGPGGQVALWPDRPNKEEFDGFVRTLTEYIRCAQDHDGNLLRHLRMADIINDWQYDQAMELLKQLRQRPEGA